MQIATATKLGEIMEDAAMAYLINYLSFRDSVGVCFWRAFDVNEQSNLMQEVYIVLCDMGFTPLESHK